MIFLGDIPPPLHGMSVINKQMLERLQNKTPTLFINTSPSWLAQFYHSPLWPLIKIIHFIPITLRLLWALAIKRERVLYRALNGGKGQIFDYFWVKIARLFGVRIYLHHHAASYLTSPSKLFSLVCKAAGSDTCHIVLGEAMHDALIKNYHLPERNIRILSNAAFFEITKNKYAPDNTHAILKIGYMANISLSKGVDVFLETLILLKQKGVAFEALIAGPCHNTELMAHIDNARAQLPELCYLGGLYEKDKADFFAAIDCFVYPSRNEAEPLVIYEAAVEGAYILSSETGCMRATTRKLKGWSMPLLSKNVWAEHASDHLEKSASALTSTAREDRKKIFESFAFESREELVKLTREITYAKA